MHVTVLEPCIHLQAYIQIQMFVPPHVARRAGRVSSDCHVWQPSDGRAGATACAVPGRSMCGRFATEPSDFFRGAQQNSNRTCRLLRQDHAHRLPEDCAPEVPRSCFHAFWCELLCALLAGPMHPIKRRSHSSGLWLRLRRWHWSHAMQFGHALHGRLGSHTVAHEESTSLGVSKNQGHRIGAPNSTAIITSTTKI